MNTYQNTHSLDNPLLDSYTATAVQTGGISHSAAISATGRQTVQQTVIGVFDNRYNAEAAVASLRQQGFTKEEINIISKQQDNTEDDDILDGTLTGSALGGIGGLLLGAGALTIPGIGPIIAAGPIAAAISGAIAGGIAGGLIDWGISADESQHYEQELMEGNILTLIRINSGQAPNVTKILRENGAIEVKHHV